MSYIKLIKLLYLLDREALLRWGRTVTTDRPVSMDKGPAVSQIYDLIREEQPPGSFGAYWRAHISVPQDWEVCLLSDPPADELSRAEESLIEEIHAPGSGPLHRRPPHLPPDRPRAPGLHPGAEAAGDFTVNTVAVHLYHDSALSLNVEGEVRNIELERIYRKRHYDWRQESHSLDDGRELSNAGKLMGLAAYGQIRPEWIDPITAYFRECSSGGAAPNQMYRWVVAHLKALSGRIGVDLSRNALSGSDARDLAREGAPNVVEGW